MALTEAEPARTSEVAPPIDRAVDEHPLEGRAREAPGRGGRLHDERVDQLVEVPLVHEQGVSGLEAGARGHGDGSAA